jgi:hypothetical protein
MTLRIAVLPPASSRVAFGMVPGSSAGRATFGRRGRTACRAPGSRPTGLDPGPSGRAGAGAEMQRMVLREVCEGRATADWSAESSVRPTSAAKAARSRPAVSVRVTGLLAIMPPCEASRSDVGQAARAPNPVLSPVDCCALKATKSSARFCRWAVRLCIRPGLRSSANLTRGTGRRITDAGPSVVPRNGERMSIRSSRAPSCHRGIQQHTDPSRG